MSKEVGRRQWADDDEDDDREVRAITEIFMFKSSSKEFSLKSHLLNLSPYFLFTATEKSERCRKGKNQLLR